MKRYKSHSSVNYDEDNVYRLLCKGKDINDPDRNGELIMVGVAETADSPYFIQTMLHCGADIYKRDTDGRNAVEAVFQNSNTKVLKALLKNVPLSKKLQVRYRVCTATKKFPKSNIPRIFGTFEDGSNLLMNAIQFKRPLAVGVDVNRLSEHPFMSQDTMLNETVKYGSVRMIKYLLGHGANPNVIDGNGETSLICCAYEWKIRCRRVAKLLIKAGAAPYFVHAEYKHSFMDVIKDEPYRDEIAAYYKKRLQITS